MNGPIPFSSCRLSLSVADAIPIVPKSIFSAFAATLASSSAFFSAFSSSSTSSPILSLAWATHWSRFTRPGKNSIAMLTSSSILDVIFAICSNLKIPSAFSFSSMNGPIPFNSCRLSLSEADATPIVLKSIFSAFLATRSNSSACFSAFSSSFASSPSRILAWATHWSRATRPGKNSIASLTCFSSLAFMFAICL